MKKTIVMAIMVIGIMFMASVAGAVGVNIAANNTSIEERTLGKSGDRIMIYNGKDEKIFEGIFMGDRGIELLIRIGKDKTALYPKVPYRWIIFTPGKIEIYERDITPGMYKLAW